MPLCRFCRSEAVVNGSTREVTTPKLGEGESCDRCGTEYGEE